MTKLNYPNKRTKIVCTIGPSSWHPEVMKAMIENGMNVARVNGAFADRNEMLRVEELVRQFSDDVALMIDIKGPEVRLNKFKEAIPLTPCQKIKIGSSNKDLIYPANYPDTYKKLDKDQLILVGDGDVRLKITEMLEDGFMAEVIVGDLLKPGKAINFPGAVLHDSPITERDRDLMNYAKERKWEFISPSFIRSPEDVKVIKEAVNDNEIQIIAKIEDGDGVKNIEKILPVVDGIMIARGGLGVNMGLENIPVVEYKLIKSSTKFGKSSIVATQMLDSMERNFFPTRAEANDIGTAILRGSDSVMLSGESTAGKYPAEAVKFMSEVDKKCEELIKPKILTSDQYTNYPQKNFLNKIFNKVVNEEPDIKNIIIFELSSKTEYLQYLAKFNLKQNVIVFVDKKIKARQLQLIKNITKTFNISIETIQNNNQEEIQKIINEKLPEISKQKNLLISNLTDENNNDKIFKIIEEK